MSINKVFISGNLTRDPEVRNTASGSQILSFSVAVNDRRKDPATGEWGDYANYIDCTMFGNRVDYFSRNLSKGSKVAVEGKLRWSQWESRDGSGKRSKIEVIVDDMELMFRGAEGGAQGGYGNASANYGNANYGNANYGNANYGNAPAQASAPAQANYGNQGYGAPASAGYSGGYSPAISTPNIDATSSVYDEDIPF